MAIATTVDPSTPEVQLIPEEIFAVSRRWLETRFSDLRYYHAAERGGHFAAFEQPQIFAREVRAGIAALEA